MILYPLIIIQEKKDEKEELKREIKLQKNIVKMQEKKVKEEILKKEQREKERVNQKRYNDLMFESNEAFFKYMDSTIKGLGLEFVLLGRENFKKKDKERLECEVFLEIEGEERGVLAFINEIENTKRYVWFDEKRFLLEKRGRCLVLKSNYMYIVKNKKIKRDVFKRERGIFKNWIQRDLKGSGREI